MFGIRIEAWVINEIKLWFFRGLRKDVFAEVNKISLVPTYEDFDRAITVILVLFYYFYFLQSFVHAIEILAYLTSMVIFLMKKLFIFDFKEAFDEPVPFNSILFFLIGIVIGLLGTVKCCRILIAWFLSETNHGIFRLKQKGLRFVKLLTLLRRRCCSILGPNHLEILPFTFICQSTCY